jgi:hypothetical protein
MRPYINPKFDELHKAQNCCINRKVRWHYGSRSELDGSQLEMNPLDTNLKPSQHLAPIGRICQVLF